jgi:hypothetical protein
MQALGALDTVHIASGHQDAAECAVPKFDETSGLVSALRTYRTHSEIFGTGTGYPLAYVDFQPHDDGTLASVYVSDNAMFRGTLGGKLAAALKECAASLGPLQASLASG